MPRRQPHAELLRDNLGGDVVTGRAARIAIGALAVGVFLGLSTGAAFAYWKAAGIGGGQGATGTTTSLLISQGTPVSGLRPSGTVPVIVTITNPNRTTIRVTSLVLDTAQGTGGFAVDAGHSGCVLSTLSFAPQNNGGAGWNIPKKVGSTNGTRNITLPAALAMSASAANACQGATFSTYLKASS